MIDITHEKNSWKDDSNRMNFWFLFSCGPPTIVHEVDKEGQEVFTDDLNTVADYNNWIFQDGTYQVPDPLQNFVPPVEEF